MAPNRWGRSVPRGPDAGPVVLFEEGAAIGVPRVAVVVDVDQQGAVAALSFVAQFDDVWQLYLDRCCEKVRVLVVAGQNPASGHGSLSARSCSASATA